MAENSRLGEETTTKEGRRIKIIQYDNYNHIVVEFDDETSKDTKGYKTPEEYWKNEDLDALKTKLEKSFNEIKSTVCKSGCND